MNTTEKPMFGLGKELNVATKSGLILRRSSGPKLEDVPVFGR